MLRSREYTATNTWAWRCVALVVLLTAMFIVGMRLFDKPREQAEALCVNRIDEALMMLDTVCADSRRRSRQVVDHCARYAIRAKTSVFWCTASTMLTEASLYRALGDFDPSWTLYLIIFSFGSIVTCCGVATCCAALNFVQRQRVSMSLPSSNYAPNEHRQFYHNQVAYEPLRQRIAYGYQE